MNQNYFNIACYWNQNSYGDAIKLNIEKKYKLPLIVLCVVTPFTNFLIPFIMIGKFMWRY